MNFVKFKTLILFLAGAPSVNLQADGIAQPPFDEGFGVANDFVQYQEQVDRLGKMVEQARQFNQALKEMEQVLSTQFAEVGELESRSSQEQSSQNRDSLAIEKAEILAKIKLSLSEHSRLEHEMSQMVNDCWSLNGQIREVENRLKKRINPEDSWQDDVESIQPGTFIPAEDDSFAEQNKEVDDQTSSQGFGTQFSNSSFQAQSFDSDFGNQSASKRIISKSWTVDENGVKTGRSVYGIAQKDPENGGWSFKVKDESLGADQQPRRKIKTGITPNLEEFESQFDESE